MTDDTNAKHLCKLAALWHADIKLSLDRDSFHLDVYTRTGKRHLATGSGPSLTAAVMQCLAEFRKLDAQETAS